MSINNDRESGTAQAFGILGDGNAEITWVDDYRQGACTAKLSDNEWAVVLPEGDEIVQLHEQSHIKFSGWESSALYNKMGQRARQLFAIIEDARVDTLGGDWYRRDLYGDHGGRLLSESGRDVFGAAGLEGPVMAIAYDLAVPLSKVGEGVRLRFGQRIADVQTDADPWASARLAFDIDRAYDQPNQPDQPDQGRGLDSADETDWHAIERKAEREARKRAALAEDERGMDSDQREIGPPTVHVYETGQAFAQVATESTIVASQTALALDGLTSGGPGRYDRVGTITPEVWRLGYGEGRVFERPARRRGRVVVAVDYSSSMACPCDPCDQAYTWRTTPAWLAAQAAAAIAQATSADVFAWTSRRLSIRTSRNRADAGPADLDVLALAPGTQRTHEAIETLSGSTPTAEALGHMAEVLGGETRDAVGVFITDGEPNDERRAATAARRLHADGVRYAVVVVGPSAGSARFHNSMSDIFPEAIVVGVASADDLAALGPALSDLLGA